MESKVSLYALANLYAGSNVIFELEFSPAVSMHSVRIFPSELVNEKPTAELAAILEHESETIESFLTREVQHSGIISSTVLQVIVSNLKISTSRFPTVRTMLYLIDTKEHGPIQTRREVDYPYQLIDVELRNFNSKILRNISIAYEIDRESHNILPIYHNCSSRILDMHVTNDIHVSPNHWELSIEEDEEEDECEE